MAIGQRIKELRNNKKLTQSALADLVNLSYIQVGRYEKGKSTPSAEVLQKLAVALDTTTDYLMNGATEQVQAQLIDRELLRQFHEVEQLNSEDKHLVKTFIDAFITKRQLQKLAQ